MCHPTSDSQGGRRHTHQLPRFMAIAAYMTSWLVFLFLPLTLSRSLFNYHIFWIQESYPVLCNILRVSPFFAGLWQLYNLLSKHEASEEIQTVGLWQHHTAILLSSYSWSWPRPRGQSWFSPLATGSLNELYWKAVRKWGLELPHDTSSKKSVLILFYSRQKPLQPVEVPRRWLPQKLLWSQRWLLRMSA